VDFSRIGALTVGTSNWRRAIERGADPRALVTELFANPVGTTVLDTSNNYGDGLSETLIGDVVREFGGVPDGILIATKLDRDPVTGDFSGERMRRSLDESLTRLGVDSLPLLFLHDPESIGYAEAFARSGPVEALVAMRERGVAASIGISGGPAPMLVRYLETGLFDAVITHNRMTLVDRSVGDMLDLANSESIAVFNAAPYGSAPLAKWPAPATTYAYRPAPAAVSNAIARMGERAAHRGVPLAAAALQFSIRDPRITSTVVGVNSLEQWAATVELARHPIPDGLWVELERLAPESIHWQDPPGPSEWNDFPAIELPLSERNAV
jgi:D-threo-aldose 1-dehydrogenase